MINKWFGSFMGFIIGFLSVPFLIIFLGIVIAFAEWDTHFLNFSLSLIKNVPTFRLSILVGLLLAIPTYFILNKEKPSQKLQEAKK